MTDTERQRSQELLAEFIFRCKASEVPFFLNVANMVRDKPGIGITDRGAYTQKQWNWLQQAKDSLRKPWE